MGYQVYRSESQTDQNFSFELAQLRVSSCVLGALRIDLRKDDENRWRRDHRLIARKSKHHLPFWVVQSHKTCYHQHHMLIAAYDNSIK